MRLHQKSMRVNVNLVSRIFNIQRCCQKNISQLQSFISPAGESISTDTIRNCIKVFEKWSVIDISSSTGVRLVSLTNLYDTSNGIQNIIQRIRKIVP